jgi:ribosomal protein S18 acetylase RimI-like enzyme
MKTSDWRDAPTEVVQPLLLAERRRVLDTLHWDLGPSLRLVEQTRQRGELAGLLLENERGERCGWTFYVLANCMLQIGALQASTAGGLRLLLDGVLESAEAQYARGISCFLETNSSSLASALTRLRFDLQIHHYLEAAVSVRPTSATSGVRPLRREDGASLVRLLARAYAGSPTARCFAPNARLEEWAQYVAHMLSGPAIGTWLPEASFVMERDGAVVAAVVTTEVARSIAHVAQIAVDPAARGTGLGRLLLRQALSTAAGLGAKRATLVVADDNAGARRLYASEGFTPRGTFLHGVRGPVPRCVGGITMRASGRLPMSA